MIAAATLPATAKSQDPIKHPNVTDSNAEITCSRCTISKHTLLDTHDNDSVGPHFFTLHQQHKTDGSRSSSAAAVQRQCSSSAAAVQQQCSSSSASSASSASNCGCADNGMLFRKLAVMSVMAAFLVFVAIVCYGVFSCSDFPVSSLLLLLCCFFCCYSSLLLFCL